MIKAEEFSPESTLSYAPKIHVFPSIPSLESQIWLLGKKYNSWGLELLGLVPCCTFSHVISQSSAHCGMPAILYHLEPGVDISLNHTCRRKEKRKKLSFAFN